jgi:hypothetical protein
MVGRRFFWGRHSDTEAMLYGVKESKGTGLGQAWHR